MSTGFNSLTNQHSNANEMQNLREPFLMNQEVQGRVTEVTPTNHLVTQSKSEQFIDQDYLKSGGHKRKLDQYLHDISSKCSMESFYEVEQVFSRTHQCPHVAVLIKILDPELRQLYAQHQVADPLLFDKETREATHIFQVWKYDKNLNVSTKVYQQLLDGSIKLADCCVSDTYVTYTIVQDDVYKQDQIVLVDIKHQSELRFGNPLRMDLTGIYVDEEILLLGANTRICELKSHKMFLESGNITDYIKDNMEIHQLPDKDAIVYAFWHPKKSPTIEVYAKSTVGLQIRIYNIKHQTKSANFMKRKQFMKKNSDDSLYSTLGQESSPKSELYLKTKINLSDKSNVQSLKNVTRLVTTGRSDLTSAIVQEEPASEEEDYLDRSDYEEDNEDKDADEDADDEEGVSPDGSQQISLHIQPSISNNDFDDYDDSQQNQDLRLSNLDLRKTMSSQVDPQPLDPLQPRKSQSQRRQKHRTTVSGSSFAGLLDHKIVRVKFYFRTTIVFTSEGDVYYVSSSNQVYSSRQIDFKSLKISREYSDADEKQRKSTQPNILDAFIHDDHLYLITEDGTIYSCNVFKYTIVKTILNTQQVKLLAFQNEIQIFTNYLTYDNVVIVSHSHILSVYDINAKIVGQNPWRHIVPDERDMDLEDQDISNLLPPSKLSSDVKPEDYHGPFYRVLQDIRLLKLREQKGQAIARIIVLYNNNIIRTLLRDQEMKWNFEHFQKKAIPGEIVQIIQSVKQCSLMFFRHKAIGAGETCNLVLFYFADQSDVQDYTVLSGIQDHQRIFQISLSNKFMNDLSQSNPRIGVYDDNNRTTTIYELRSEQDSAYGQFMPLFTIQNEQRIQTQDVIIESGNEDFVYLARANVIYKYHLTEELGEHVHQRLETFVSIQLRNQSAHLSIKAFRVYNDGDFIYASTRTHLYFNYKDRFGKLYSESKLMPTIAKNNCLLYSDDIYCRISGFIDPFNIQVFPFLHSNRQSLIGVHHQPQPIFFQNRGVEDFYLLTKNAELMTWSMITGKLKYYCQFTNKYYMGFQKLNTHRGRTLLFKQNEKANYEYLLLEIVKKDEIIQHAKVVSENKFNMYINSKNDLLFRKSANKRNDQFEIISFDKESGQLQKTLKTFYQWMPLHFLSPSFDFYICIDFQKCRIQVKRTMSDIVICTLPDNIVNHLYFKRIDFTIENLVNKLIFLEDDLILFELKENFEVVYCVSKDKVLMDFNKMNSFYNFNEHLIAKEYEVDRSKNQRLLQQQTWEHEIDDQQQQQQSGGNKQADNQPKKGEWWLRQLSDFKFLNQKYLRDKTFIVDYQNTQFVRDREGALDDVNVTQFKMISVQPFSYGLWKMINLVTRANSTITISNMKPEIQALMAFTILPKENQTLLHKFIKHDPDQLRELIRCQKTLWPAHPFPHLKNAFGESPLGISLKRKNRRFSDALIKYIETLPEDYCQQEVTQYLTTFVEHGYETRVSEYLNARLIKPIWTEKYSRGNLIVSEQNMNQATTANWPSDTYDVEYKFFGKNAENVPLQVQMLNVANLHAFTNPQSQDLLIALITCNINLLACPSIQYLIEYKWEIAYPSILYKLFIPFILYLVNFQIYLEILFYPTENKNSVMFLWETFGKILLLIFALYFLSHHFIQLRERKFHFFSMAMAWSLTDMVPLLVNLISITFEFTAMSQETYVRWTRPMYGMATLFLWLKVFYFLRMFRNFGQLVLMIFTVIGQMGTFFAVFFFFIVAFGNTFYSLSMANPPDERFVTGYLDGWRFTYLVTLRNFDINNFGTVDVTLVWIMFILCTLFFIYIMLHLTVSMVKLYYDGNKRIEREQTYRVMCELIIECIDKISPPEIEKELMCTEEKAKYCIKQDEEYDESEHEMEKAIKKKTFRNYLRPENIGNQYLLVAKPRHEEDIVVEVENPVMTAFKGLGYQFTNQMTHLKKRIDATVNMHVSQSIEELDQKLESMQEKHDDQIKNIKQTQNLILEKLKQMNQQNQE